MTRLSSLHLRLLAVLLFIGSASTVSAQFLLKANGTDYPVVLARFGDQIYCTTGISGEWSNGVDATPPVTNACEPVVNDLTGKIAMIDRGVCNFDIKCLNAQNAGAIAVIVCNHQGVAPIVMDGETVDEQITVPCFMASRNACNEIRLLPSQLISIEPAHLSYPDAIVIWGDQTGEGDFDGGLNGWEINNISCANGVQGFDLWRWISDPIVDDGYGGSTLTAATACNGAMAFNSAAYDSNNSQSTGSGPCPAVQEGELISPTIDLSNTSAQGISLQFMQLTRQFRSRYFVGYSIDNGQSWTEIEINEDLIVNADPVNTIIRMPLQGIVGASEAKIKFRYEGDYYYWAIDDVRLIEQEEHNMRLDKNFFAIAQNAMTPKKMIERIAFMTNIANAGSVVQADVKLNMTVRDQAGLVVFDEDLSYGNMEGNTAVETMLFESTYTPPWMTGTYRATYSLDTPDDFDESDNEVSFNFAITDTVWAKESGVTRTVTPSADSWEPGEEHTWAYGNHFYVPGLNGPTYAASMSFAIDAVQTSAAVTGQVVQLSLYKWNDVNNDGDAQNMERQLVGFGAYMIQGTETEGNLILIEFDGGWRVELEANTHYILMLEFNSPNETTDLWIGASDAYNYNAMIFANGENGLADPRYGSMLAIGDLATEAFSSTGFGTDIVPVVRLNIVTIVGTKDPLSDNNLVAVYPNPVQEVLNLSYELEQAAQNLSIRIMDVTGKVVMERQYSQAKSDTINFNVKELAAGTYNVQLTSENGTTSRRFVVAK